MITQKTAVDIWSCYSEIEKGKKLLADMEDKTKWGKDPTPVDVFGRQRKLSFGIPCGDNGERMIDVSSSLAMSVIRAHIANKEAELVAANEQARIELDQDAKK